ncbi:GNAT family N-acetyltransferase [Nocardioides bizhenqiangii]|uniref:GNAT family N-acetyltransferase n=1 Tax=Nocardioides bizhenqiangii TaxID=3095076 RepID=UPI0038620C83
MCDVVEPTIRDATAVDAAACAAIYGHYVRVTPATFELEPPSVEEIGRRIAACQAGHAFLVAETDGVVTGFAYGTRFAERPAYRWSCEVSVYLDPERVGGGTGSALYAALLERLQARGFHVVFAKVAQPNDASNALHARFGFERVGLLRRVGFKLGGWHDVAILQRDLVPPMPSPMEPA